MNQQAWAHQSQDDFSTVAHVYTKDDAALIVSELRLAGIEAKVVAEPEMQSSGPFDIIVRESLLYDAVDVIDDIEIIDEPDDWFGSRPVWQRVLLLLVGVAAVLLPLFYALVEILSG